MTPIRLMSFPLVLLSVKKVREFDTEVLPRKGFRPQIDTSGKILTHLTTNREKHQAQTFTE
jgi:hypothetical protein